MGRAKAHFDDVQHRGWENIEAFVCSDCVEDDFLRALIDEHAESETCDYCSAQAKSPLAAPVDVVTEAIVIAARAYFANPANAGVPYESREGGFQGKMFGTRDVLMHMDFNAHDKLFSDIEQAIVDDVWVEASGGHFFANSYVDELMGAWDQFVSKVKHQSRYFFHDIYPDEDEYALGYRTSNFFPVLADIARDSLIAKIPEDASLFRTRVWQQVAPDWVPEQHEMGAPPADRASAGRMNAAGISYLYVALEKSTAIAEVFHGPPANLAIARFKTVRELTVLDLTKLPTLPSIFDHQKAHDREIVLFLYQFTDSITQPVFRDGREHIDYVPTQVMCEYFQRVFNLGDHENPKRIDGIKYPSAVRPGGNNLVLFPSTGEGDDRFGQVKYKDYEKCAISAWSQVNFVLGSK
jgi:RES domain-containing protein